MTASHTLSQITPSQINLVRDSYPRVVALGPVVADIFYDHLFARDPELRAMFRNDMTTQGRMLLQALSYVVANLDAPQRLMPVVTDLGLRHVHYGVTPDHYASVGVALMETLSDGLGEAFDWQSREAWAAAYRLLSGAMIDAAYVRPAA